MSCLSAAALKPVLGESIGGTVSLWPVGLWQSCQRWCGVHGQLGTSTQISFAHELPLIPPISTAHSASQAQCRCSAGICRLGSACH